MAIPSGAPFNITGDTLVDVATSGYTWGLPADRTLRWSLSNGFNGEEWASEEVARDVMNLIFQTYALYADINFTYAGYFADPAVASPSADINITLDASNALFTSRDQLALGFFPYAEFNQIYSGAPGDIFLNLSGAGSVLTSYLPGSQGYFLFLHEIGHALGLKHPHDTGGTARPTLASLDAEVLDVDWFSVMSYNDDNNWNQFGWDPATPMLLDVLAIQYLYGPNLETGAGDTTYTLPLNEYYATLWDASGWDIIDLSGSTVAWDVALPDLQLSSLVATKAGFAQPVTTGALETFYWLTGDIENVFGSGFADTLTGTAANNVLQGNGGNDVIDGGEGIDTLGYSGARANFTITMTSTGYTVTDRAAIEGTDTVSNVERLKFADSSVSLEIEGNAGQAYRLYQAAFDRAPDPAGLGFWMAQMDSGMSLPQVASLFQQSAEFNALYGSNVSTAQFVTLLYQNALDRAPDPAGFANWTNLLNSNQISRAEALVGFSESAENKAKLIGVMQNGMDYIESMA